jgi:hypothetical protein
MNDKTKQSFDQWQIQDVAVSAGGSDDYHWTCTACGPISGVIIL